MEITPQESGMNFISEEFYRICEEYQLDEHAVESFCYQQVMDIAIDFDVMYGNKNPSTPLLSTIGFMGLELCSIEEE